MHRLQWIRELQRLFPVTAIPGDGEMGSDPFLRKRFQFESADWERYTDSSEDGAMFSVSPHLSHLSKLMDAAELRQRVISHNLANVNTPGYRRLDVDFEEALAKQVKAGQSELSSVPEPQIHEEQGLPSRADGNNVDVDREISQLNRNSMMFQTYSQLVASQLELMRRAIRSP
jgi:flagellar basal-body rod protein FlgB